MEFFEIFIPITSFYMFMERQTIHLLHLNAMKEAGTDPTVLHYTTLIDGLSWAGNLLGCQYFFDEMIKTGCMPDVVCYTVMTDHRIYNGR